MRSKTDAIEHCGRHIANPRKVCLKNGFDTNHIYELIYTAKDPIVMGLGLAAIRDVASFFHRAPSSAGNPIAGAIHYTLLNGISQSGRLLRIISISGSTRVRMAIKSSMVCSRISERLKII